MTDFDILKELLNREALLPLEGDSKQPRVLLKEESVTDSSATLKRLPSDAVVIALDKYFPAQKQIFSGNHGECRRADYLIISSSLKRILYIEMKKTRGNPRDISQQLQGAHCFCVYMQQIGKSFWKKKDFLDGYQHYFLSIKQTGKSTKRPTDYCKKSKKNNSAEKPTIINFPKSLDFNSLF